MLGVYLHLYASVRASTHRYLQRYLHLYALVLEGPVLRTQLLHSVVANLPHPLCRIPPAPCGSQRALQLRFPPTYAHSDNRGARRLPAPGLPVGLLYDELGGLVPLADLLVVAIAHTYPSIPVLIEQSLCFLLTWLQALIESAGFLQPPFEGWSLLVSSRTQERPSRLRSQGSTHVGQRRIFAAGSGGVPPAFLELQSGLTGEGKTL